MCWSGEASAAIAAVGLATTAWAAYRKEPAPLWLALGYFSLMELLQAFTYTVIDECGTPANQIATLLGYLHIAFQPFFVNAISMYFIPADVRQRIAPVVYMMCFVATVMMLIQLYPMDWAGSCVIARPLCGPELCSVSGDWHIAWDIPLNGIGNAYAEVWGLSALFGGLFMYFWTAFFLPLFYGSWRFTLYHLISGPLLAKLLTSNPNEWAAVWCLLSIGILLIVVKTPVRGYLHVRQWFWWPLIRRGVARHVADKDK